MFQRCCYYPPITADLVARRPEVREDVEAAGQITSGFQTARGRNKVFLMSEEMFSGTKRGGLSPLVCFFLDERGGRRAD